MNALTSIQDIEEDLKVHVENKKDFKDTNRECIVLGSITVKHNIKMKWLDLINKYPTTEEYKSSWCKLYRCYPDECTCELLSIGGICIKTPNGTFNDGGFLKEYTDEPVLNDRNKLWYECGTTWGVDDNGNFYRLLDKKNGYPYDWDKVKAMETIKAYWKVEKCIKRDNLLSQLLD